MAEPNRILNSAETYIDSGLRGIPKQPKSQTAENEKIGLKQQNICLCCNMIGSNLKSN